MHHSAETTEANFNCRVFHQSAALSSNECLPKTDVTASLMVHHIFFSNKLFLEIV